MYLDRSKCVLRYNNIKFFIENEEIPQHFHVTEIGKENRIFLDCGGTKRQTEKCVLQVWVTNDTEHRINSNKLLKIIELGEHLFEHDIPDVYIEYEKNTVSQYPISHYEITDNTIEFYLGKIHTACLAPDKCGVNCCKPLIQINKDLRCRSCHRTVDSYFFRDFCRFCYDIGVR